MRASARKSFQMKKAPFSFLSQYQVKSLYSFLFQVLLLVALMHLSSGRREDKLQGFAFIMEVVFAVVGGEGKE